MSGFLRTLWSNLLAIPSNIRTGLRPLPTDPAKPSVRMRRAFFYHLHPMTVTRRALRPFVTMGLGLASITLFVLLCISGALLMVYYDPSATGAHASLMDIQYAVPLGAFLRSLHRWSAHAMVLVVVMHMFRVASQGAYSGRQLNWTIGLSMLVLTMGLAFTGYLLPWDQRSYWAVTVTASMLDHFPLIGESFKELFLGGSSVGGATLLRFYALHVAWLPVAVLVLMALHLWRLRKDGGLAIGSHVSADVEKVPAWPHLVLREASYVLVLLAVMFVISSIFSASLGGAPDIHHPSNPEKAPWYFLWLQEMVSYSVPVGGVLYPVALVLLLIGIPLLDREKSGVGMWFGPPKAKLVIMSSILLATGAFILFEFLYMSRSSGLYVAEIGTDILNPATGMLVLSVLVFFTSGILAASTRTACLSALFVLVIGLVGFMLVGVCRGPDWIFYWPWQEWPHGF